MALCRGIDAETLEVRAAEEQIGSVTADDIRDTRGCHSAIAAPGANATMPPGRNARNWKGHDPGLPAPNEALRTCKRFGQANRRNGPHIAGDAAWTPGCEASNARENASWHEPSTGRMRRSGSASHS